MTQIHPSAIVHDNAVIGEGCVVDAYAVIGDNVVIGDNNRIGAHSVVDGPTQIGDNNTFGTHNRIGAPPQDMTYRGEPTRLVIGSDNVFSDFIQLSRGSTKTEEQTTTIGNECFIMAYGHVGHDCTVGNNLIAANSMHLGGHVTVEDNVVIGGLVAIHQFVRIGRMAMVSGGTVTSKDVTPFTRIGAYGGVSFGLNLVGLKRAAGIEGDTLKGIKGAYKLLFKRGLNVKESVERVREEFPDNAYALEMADFVEGSQRGVVRERGAR